jgi:NAD(P)-dependent dehydrogenase (short-subunit alcohol dehydrogenase family)/uncharacterized OB-fold protein
MIVVLHLPQPFLAQAKRQKRGHDMTSALQPPKRKNPLKRTRLPVPPPALRSRQWHMLTKAAAEGIFGLPTCQDCEQRHYPPRDICPQCLSHRIVFKPCSDQGRVEEITDIHISNSVYFRERQPWHVGFVTLEAGPGIIAHLHTACQAGDRVTLQWRLDKSGNATAFAQPVKPDEHMMDDVQMREMTLDPKHRRVLVTDGRTPLGQAVAKALSEAGAAIVFVGVSEDWKPFAGHESLEKIPRVELMPLDISDHDSVFDLANEIGSRVDIVVNTGQHIRPGGLLERKGVTVAREEMDAGYMGFLRLVQAFAPVMKFRGADGINSACAWVNILSIYAHMPWPAYAAYSAAQAALYNASLSLRTELRDGGVRVLHLFTGPTEDDWFQPLPPPKVAYSHIAKSVVEGLKAGLEDLYVGDVAQDFKARLDANPKALEREISQ